MTKTQVAELLRFVHSARGSEGTVEEVEAWFVLLHDLDYLAAMGAAATVLADTSRRPGRVQAAEIIAQVRWVRRDAASRVAVEARPVDPVPRPSWFDEAVAAAAAARERCAEHGFGRGDEVTVRSTLESAEDVRHRAEVGGVVP